MVNKNLRILIAESAFYRLLQIEKMLNQLGYYCIAPMRSFDELFSVIYEDGQRFDVLFVNARLLGECDHDIMKLLERKKKVFNTLIYTDQSFSLKPVLLLGGSGLDVFMTPVVNIESMTAYMDIVDGTGADSL